MNNRMMGWVGCERKKELKSCSNRSGQSHPRLGLPGLITDLWMEEKRWVRSVRLAGVRSRVRNIQPPPEPLAGERKGSNSYEWMDNQ